MRNAFRVGGRAVAPLALVVLVATAGAAAAQGSALDGAIRHLRTAVHSQRDGSHLGQLLALRQLRDPQLAPVFRRLLDHEEWQVQVHAVLGLAEINSPMRIDPSLVMQIPPLAQEAVIASALDLELLTEDQIPELLAWTDLNAMARLLLYAEQVSNGKDIDRSRLRGLASDSDYRVAALASLLLAEGGDDEPLERLTSRLRGEGRVGARKVLWILDAVRQYRLGGAEQWIRSLLDHPQLDRATRETAVLAAMTIDPVKNIDLWKRALAQEEASASRRVRYGLMLLHCGKQVPAGAYDNIVGDDELTLRMADAGRGLSTGIDASSAIIELLNHGHVRSIEWALDAAESLSESEAVRIYMHAIDRLDFADRAEDPRDRRPRAEWMAAAIQASAKLFAVDPEQATRKLLSTSAEGEARQAMLLGMLQAHDRRAGDSARLLDVSGFGRAESLAMLLIARHADTLSRDELSHLGLVASGGGRLSAELRAQAAWLYIKHSGQMESALRRVFE